MARTEVRSEQIGDGQVKRADLNTGTAGAAVIAKVLQGTGITFTSTGADAGTGDVTLNVTPAEDFMPFVRSGTLTVAPGVTRLRWPVAVTIVGVSASIATAPTGAAVIADVNKNGTTIFTTQGNRPTIAVSTNAVGETVPDVTAYAAGDYMTVDVDQIGSTVAGADLMVMVRFRKT